MKEREYGNPYRFVPEDDRPAVAQPAKPKQRNKIGFKHIVLTFVFTFLIAWTLAQIGIARAGAAPGLEPGCETIRWGFLGSQRRTICDGPKREDGSWKRFREVWTPGGWVPLSIWCGSYSCTTSGGYYREQSTQAYEEYIVYDWNVLPDEPGWLPPGTVVIK